MWLRYQLPLEQHRTVKGALSRIHRRRRETVTVEALRGVSFDVDRGGVVAVVGLNGAGKSTLLRVVAGILPPSAGRVEVSGKACTVLTLGVGFNAQLSGRDNVVLGGMAAGLSRGQVAERFEDIEDFAGLGPYIDAPTRTYSAGMFARLAFAVAVATDPEILLVDEMLGAGDAAFQERCREKIAGLRERQCTILLASHNVAQVRNLSDTCLWLHRGQMRRLGPTAEVTAAYQHFHEAHRQATAGGSLAR